MPIHRLSSALQDTKDKVDFLNPSGRVLDTCMGLGYTAILTAQRASQVITFEKDENVLFLAKLNPVSGALFSLPNIKIEKNDVVEGIKGFPPDYFDCILHNPPTFRLAPELYSHSFYRQLLRTLKIDGRLFHYTPFYKIRQGYNFAQKIAKNLKETGFRVLEISYQRRGILCQK